MNTKRNQQGIVTCNLIKIIWLKIIVKKHQKIKIRDEIFLNNAETFYQ